MKNAIIVVSVLVLIGFGWIIFKTPSSNISKKTSQTTDESPLPTKGAKVNTKTTSQIDPTKYVEYTKSALTQSVGKKRVLYFYANWCPTCKPINEEFLSSSGEIPDGVVVIRVNYNDDQTDKDEEALAKKYAITYQHTFVQIDDEGETVERWNGGGLEELKQNIK